MTQTPDPDAARSFALEVVRKLREAGFEAYWAGGCVRDMLLGVTPGDFDVATSARPESVMQLFGRRRTLAIGAAFGVVAVRGPRSAGMVEVATFRQDTVYSDGRRPDAVHFSSAEEDARRRDFTINGMFYDPMERRVIDYVGGRADLDAGWIRAIGDPDARIAEDKLRMLRAIRFATRLDYQIEPETLAAIQRHAATITVVSGERVAAEMEAMLIHPRRRQAMEAIDLAGLWPYLSPEIVPPTGGSLADDPQWRETLTALHALVAPSFATALAVLLRSAALRHRAGRERARVVVDACKRWRTSNDVVNRVEFLLDKEALVLAGREAYWPALQRVLIHRFAGELVDYAAAVACALGSGREAVAYCRAKLDLPPGRLNPEPFLRGDDVIALGGRPGPRLARVLEAVRDAQLLGRVASREEAMVLAAERLRGGEGRAE